jgi:hypothetical protein
MPPPKAIEPKIRARHVAISAEAGGAISNKTLGSICSVIILTLEISECQDSSAE